MTKRTVLIAIAVMAGLAVSSALYLPSVRQELRQLPVSRSILAAAHNIRESYDPVQLGDGRSRLDIRLISPGGLAEDKDGNVYVSDRAGVIWRIDTEGHAEIIAGTGRKGTSQPGKDAKQIRLGTPEGIGIGPKGLVHFTDSFNHVVMRIEADGTLSRVAGVGVPGFAGDGAPAEEALLDQPYQIRFDDDGSFYIVDSGNNRIRMVDSDGIIRTVAGPPENGRQDASAGYVEAGLRKPFGAYYDHSNGRLLIGDSGNHVVRELSRDGNMSILAGTGERGYSGDGGPAIQAKLDSPQDLIIDAEGYVYVIDEHNNAIRIISPDGRIQALLGNGRPGHWRSSRTDEVFLANPEALLARRDGSLLVVDNHNRRVRILTPDGQVSVFAGAEEMNLADMRGSEKIQ